MKKIITVLALMITSIIANSQVTTIAPGFTLNSTPTYTNTGFKHNLINSYEFVKNMDSLTYYTNGLLVNRFDTLKLNDTYDTIKVHMTVVLCAGNTTTISINGINTVYISNNGDGTSKTFQYNQIITNSNQLNYIVSTLDASYHTTQRTTLKNYTVKLIKNLPPTGINELSNKVNVLNVFPNPAASNFKIKFNATTEKVLVQIYDMQGNLVLENNDERNIGQNILNIDTNLATGIYFIKADKQYVKLIITN
jgi:hypothetical protein